MISNLSFSISMIFIVMAFSISSSAENITATESVRPTGTTSVGKIKELLQNKKFTDDSEITDSKLKADEGSRSQYSVKFGLSYYGPRVGDLNNPKQPNPDGSAGTFDTSIGGNISARLRLSPTTAVSVGTGVNALTPLQGVSRYDVNNPFVGYDTSSRLADLQIRNSISLIDNTNPDFAKVAETGGLMYGNFLVYNFAATKWAVEFDSTLSYWLYSRAYSSTDALYGSAGTYFLTFYPYLKYNLSDKINMSTSLCAQYYNPRSEDNQTILWNKALRQRVTFGYSFSKDIYVSPYINFYPNNLKSTGTTINIDATFSIL